jgi:phosphoribosylformylglycinamidine synthase subunit PurSL
MPASARSGVQLHRVEVRPRANAGDPRAQELAGHAARCGLKPTGVRSARVYLIEGALGRDDLDRVVDGLLANPVTEKAFVGASAADGALVEIHPLPGVMDPPAQTVRDAIAELTGVECRVTTGWRYDLRGVSAQDAAGLARKVLANPVVTGVHTAPFHPGELPKGHAYELKIRHIEIRDLDDAALERLSRAAHLFLSLDEMRAIRDEYRRLEREPTDIELETLAQTWSEHCVHKTLKATVRYESDDPNDPVKRPGRPGRPGHETNADGSVTIHNLLKSSVAAATFELIEEGIDWTLSVFVDNAGIIAFDDDHAVCIKVETHNHPSAIEPYGGAATGIGGCIRDIMGTGLAARPIANTNVFCVAHPNIAAVPNGCLPPERVLREVVAGVRDYGNRMGIPTVNGAVWFDDRHIGNPLVFAGCVGVMPRDLIGGAAKAGDLIVALGGRTGRDGIHGATFSSAELTDTHADEFSHAVQIGNAIEEKRVLDAILRARDHHEPGASATGCLYTAITDCGAGGFSSAVGEMGEKLGATVLLENAPLKYDGLSYTEIWISEAQERMVLAVPQENLAALRAICDEEHVELSVLGTFGTPGRDLVLTYRGTEVGRLPMEFLHDGIPMPTREARWEGRGEGAKAHRHEGTKPENRTPESSLRACVPACLRALLSHPNIASKHWIINQYDHEVQGNTVVKPLVGPAGRGPSDAAVIEPVAGTGRGLAIGCGLATGLEADPYQMTLAAIDECVRNLVCAGADPDRIAILDNFSWPSCKKPENLGSLVRAAEGCYDGAKAYRTPFVSGKDSLNNQFTTEDGRTIEIPPTLLITGIGMVHELDRAVTMDAKKPGNTLLLVGPACESLTGSHHDRLFGSGAGPAPAVDLEAGPRTARVVADAVQTGIVRSAHDVSDGGLLVAVAEMLIAGSGAGRPIGFTGSAALTEAMAFCEGPSRYVLEVEDPSAAHRFSTAGCVVLGRLTDTGRLEWGDVDESVEDLAKVWRAPLDW